MSQPGYSIITVIKKTGIKPKMRVLLTDDLEKYFDLPGQNIFDQYILKNEIPALIHLFAK